jgi:hypothetical protein
MEKPTQPTNLVLYVDPQQTSSKEAMITIEKYLNNKTSYQYQIIDITKDETLAKAFSTFVPALAIDGRMEFYGKINRAKLNRILKKRMTRNHIKSLISSINKIQADTH